MRLLSNSRVWRFVALLLVCAAFLVTRSESSSAASPAPTSLTLKFRAAYYDYCQYYYGYSCYGRPTITFRLGTTVIGSQAVQTEVTGGGYDPAEQTITVNDPAILNAVLDAGCNELSMTASVDENQYGYVLMGYGKVEINRPTGTEVVTIADFNGSSSYVGSVNWDYIYNYGAGNTQSMVWSTPAIPDTDNDGVNDCADPDSDNDGILNAADNCPINPNPTQVDSDGNGQGDACDHEFDRDYDGIWNAADNCPDKFNPTQADYDGNGQGDACDMAWDLDRDGIANAVDNCPTDPNPTQADYDNNGTGDACDGAFDTDSDGIPNVIDNCPANPNPLQGDTNNDGVGDACSAGVVAVPWLGSEALAHEVYSGGSIPLQAVASNAGTGAAISLASGTWDPGDGSGPVSINVSNSLNLELNHTYTGAVGQPFTATISVVTTGGVAYTDTMKVVIKADTRETRVNMAIDRGLWNLHTRMTYTTSDSVASAYWYGYYGSFLMASTASTVQAFEINNHRESGDAGHDPYVNDVTRGLRYILSSQHGMLQHFTPTMQGANNPDADGNGIALGVQHNQNDHTSYVTGQVMDAIVASGTPNRLAVTGENTYVKGRSYRHIIQDMLDGYSWGMADDRGGWYYYFQGTTGSNDTSASHWWAIGVLAARTWNLDAPEWVKSIQKTVGMPLMQAYPGDGHFGYTDSKNSIWDDATNVTAAGLILMNADDMTHADPRFAAASNYLKARFDASTGNFYTMYQTTKAMRTAYGPGGINEPVELLAGSIDWQAKYDDFLVANQNASGAFTQTQGTPGIFDDMATSWAVIMLSPSLFELPPSASCTASPATIGTHGGLVNFTAAASFHPDPDKTIVGYSWNFGDGSPVASGLTVSHSFAQPSAFPTTRNVVVTVTDSGGQTATSSCPVTIVDTNVPPNAVTGGPYTVCVGSPLILDGSMSHDEDGSIASYQWDWAAPIDFASVDATTSIVDATSAFSSRAPGTYDLGLRVIDNDGAINSTFTTVTVRAANNPACNQPPVAVNDNASTFAGTPVTVAVLANDSDPNSDPLSTTSATNGANGTTVVNGDGTVTYTPNLGYAGVDTFTYAIADGKGGTASATVTVTVKKRDATVTAGSGTKVYGSADPVLTPTSTGFLAGISVSQTARDAGENVGTYATHATATGATLANYTVTTTDGTLTITQAASTAVATGGTFDYDGNAHAGSCTFTGVNNESLTGTLTYSSGTAPVDAGSYTVTCDFAGDTNYTASSDTATITINKLSATVTAGSGTKVYGSADPVLTPTSTGFLAGIAVSQTARDAGENVGTYATHATATGATLANYTVTTTDGTLTITQAASTAVATGGTFDYDGNAHAGACTVTGVNNETLTGTLTYSSGSAPVDAGSYTVTCDFAGDTNYTASSDTATITINKLSATVTAGSGTKVYGSADPVLTPTSTGFLAGISVSQTARDAGETVGSYATHAAAAGATLANYDVTYTDGALTITQAASTAVATGGTFDYDGNAHAGACTVTGVNNETLTGTLTYSSGSAPVDAGSYTVTCDFAGDTNYTASSDTATITINKLSATVTAGSGTKVYGSADPVLTPTSTGFVTAITVSQTVRDAGENVGSYATHATAAGATLANYDVTYTDGTLTITQAASTAVATGGTFTYDGNAHAGSCTFTGVNNESLTGTLTYSSGTAPVNAGSYTVTCDFAGDTNYTASSDTATITINKAATSTAVNAPTITVAANGSVTVTVASAGGTVVGNVTLSVDGGAAVTKALAGGSATFTQVKPDAGDHPLAATYAAQGNFAASSATGNLHVNPSPTSTTLATSAAAQLSGQAVTFTATVVSVAPGSGTPNGVVTFKEGATVLGTGTLNAAGVATFTTTTLSNGPHTITAVYNGVNNYLTSTSNTVSKLIYSFATGGGTFVIADTEAAMNANVNFWGSQWEKANVPSGGKSNASFKGFAITPAVPTIGATFTSAPGNSAPPPSGVPQYIGIIVTSKVTKSGSNITGTIVGLVVVRVDPGYQGNPGHAGTGTIVAFIQ